MWGPLAALTAVLRPATDRLQVAGFQIGWYAVRRLPEPAAYLAFDALADVLVRRGGKGLTRLRANYARVRPELGERELDALVSEGMRSYMRYFCEAFRLNDLSAEQLADIVRTSGDGPVRELLAQGRSVVVFIAHMGNWDLAGAWSTLHLAPVTTVAERLEPEEVFQGFLDFRESLGMTILPLTGGPDPFVGLKAAAGRGDFIALVADRDLTRNGVEVDFCGQRARMAKGPAVLSVLTGAPLFAASIYYTRAERGHGIGGRHVFVEFSEQIERPQGVPTAVAVESMVADCAAHLEAGIREHTADWHMLQRVFAEDLDPARTPRAARA
jgi:KDO2-lipid IV(A) lauroyltransferase